MKINPRKIPEITEAIELFEEFEKHLPNVSNIDLFTSAVEILNDFIEENPDTQYKEIVQNIKISYTRRILQHLKSIDSSEIGTWFNIVIAILKAKDEFEALAEENPGFKADYDDFMSEWKGTYELKQLTNTILQEMAE